MADLSNFDLSEKTYTPEEVWGVVDRIPNTERTHWNIFGLKVLPAIMNLLLKDHAQDAYDIALAWAQRSPKFDEKHFAARWAQLVKRPLDAPGMHTLQSLAEAPADAAGDDLRATYDALRQACAVVAAKLRREEAERIAGEMKAAGRGVRVGADAPVYSNLLGLDDIVLAFLDGCERMPVSFPLERVNTGGHRFTVEQDIADFSDCHREIAQVVLVERSVAMARMQPADWAVVRQRLLRIASVAEAA